MTAIPEDIKLAARAVAYRLCPFRFAEERKTFVVEKWPVVAAALVAERSKREAAGKTTPPAPPPMPPRPVARTMLTRKQKATLNFLIAYIAEHDLAPSHDEIKAELGLVSKSSVNRLLIALEERGHIRRLPNRARAIEVLG